MKISPLAAVFLASSAASSAQIRPADSIEPLVSTATTISENYAGHLRPQVHYSPPQHFMNDPNGCFLDETGTWHLYYQYNPTANVAGNQHWGHATSRDLYHWKNQPIALFPPDNESAIYSGSVVVDGNNTSGFFPNQDNGVVAIYTLNTPTKQVQEIAYSHDGGYSFVAYEGNPVIGSTSTQFRDPKVVRYHDRWVMVVAYSQDFAIGIYTSLDLKQWTHASNFSHHGLLGLQYECPNMVELPVDGTNETMYVLTISINPGAPLGGSTTQYFPGNFNGTHFIPVDNAARIADFGKDNYAAQFFYGTPVGPSADAVSIAWASNWQYAQAVPTATEGWRSVMTLPRRNRLANIHRVGWTLVSLPYDLTPILGRLLGADDSLVNASFAVDYSVVESNAIYFEANVTGLPSAADMDSAATLNFTAFSPASTESVSGGYFFGGDNPFWLDRGKTSGFDDPFFSDKFSTAQPLDPSGSWSLSGVIDRSIIEVFLDGGISSATATFFPVYPLEVFAFNTAGIPAGVNVSVAVWALESGWTSYEDEGASNASLVERQLRNAGSLAVCDPV